MARDRKARSRYYATVARFPYMVRQGGAYDAQVHPYSVLGVGDDWVHLYDAAGYCLDAIDPARGSHVKAFGGSTVATVNRE